MMPTELPVVDEEPFTFTPEDQEIIDEIYDPRKYYKMFNIDELGVSVVEMDPSERAARNLRTLFERQDFGALEQEARNEIDRKAPNLSPQLTFNRVEGVGHKVPNVPKTEIRQKLALMPDTSENLETIETLSLEAEIIVAHIRKRLKQFVYPWDVTPHLTFAAFRKRAQVSHIKRVMKLTNGLFTPQEEDTGTDSEHHEQVDVGMSGKPFGVRLDRKIEFRHKSSRGNR
jgi:hypothetical protein